MEVQLLPACDRTAAGRIWQALEERHGCRPTTSWAWTATWLEHFGDVVAHEFALGSRGGEPRGIALVTRSVERRGPLALAASHVGTAGEPAGEGVHGEPQGAVAAPADRGPFLAALLDLLAARSGWDELRLPALEPADADVLLAARPGLLARREACPVADFTGVGEDGGDVLTLMSARRNIRRRMRRLDEVRTLWASSTAEALDVLEELIELHQAHWTARGRRGAFGSARVRAFHRELVRRTFDDGMVVLFRASCRDGTLGCVYGHVDGPRVLGYQLGTSSKEALVKAGPGVLTLALCMQACFERGFAEYDTLAGDSEYKRSITNATGELTWLTLPRRSLKWSAVDHGARVRRAVRSRTRA